MLSLNASVYAGTGRKRHYSSGDKSSGKTGAVVAFIDREAK